MNIVSQGITVQSAVYKAIKEKKKKKKPLDVELSIFLMGFGKERRGVSTSDAHLGDVRVHMCITASDLCCTEHVSRH